MSSLSRVHWAAQMRCDLHHLLAAESYTAFDFRALITAFTGTRPFVLRGLEVIGKTGLSITVSMKDALTFNPLDGNGSFYRGLSDDSDALVDLPADQENLFVEARFRNSSNAPINTAYWDPLALTGEDVAGTEYSASSNSQVVTEIAISVNTVGFSDDAIPILRASTVGSDVTEMVDCRPMLFRLGAGGTTPNAAHRFPWATTREDSPAVGTGVGVTDDNSPFLSRDLSGVKNDKGITSFKDWFDAVMTRISEVSGSSLWFASPDDPLYGYVTGLDIPRIFLDSESGHSLQPSANVSFKWVRNGSGNLVLRSSGQSSVKWQANYGPVSWELGGTFTNNTLGGERAYDEIRFESPVPVDNGNIYLLLERDVDAPFASGNAVKWASDSAYPGTFNANKAVSGVAGDFTGIAVGDWIKKKSEGFSQYYRVTGMSDGPVSGIRATEGDVADGTVIILELDRIVTTGASTESLDYFRARYSSDDLVVDATPGQYNYRDSNYYWLGRRVGTTFILRGYGNLQEGEESLVMDDSFLAGGQSSDSGSLTLQHTDGAAYNHVTGYSQRKAATTLVTIRRRKRDNTVEVPAVGDNSGASLVYTIDAPVGLMSEGDGLWVRLSDTAGGTLASGSVTNTTDDDENTDTSTNRWEVRTAADNPMRNFDNKDIYLIARRITLSNGNPALLFLDGTTINQYGQAIDEYLEVLDDGRFVADVYLATKTPKSVLFIDQTISDPFSGQGRIDEDNAEFNYDKTLKQLNLFNNIFDGIDPVSQHRLEAATDQYWFTNLGAHSLYLGGALSNVVIPGNLTVLGSQTITSTQNVAISDKNMLFGIGNSLLGGGGSGISVADNTLDWQSVPNAVVSFTTYAGLKYVDVAFTSDPGYVLGQLVGVASNFQLDQITEADASMIYTRVATATVPGDVERLSATVWRFWTNGTALTGVVASPASAVNNWQIFDILSEIHLSKSDTDTSGMTSWSFGVKRPTGVVQANNEGTIHAVVTPYESALYAQDFLTIPTAKSANFVDKRIPFAYPDGSGPSSKDTTFDFTNRLTWDNSTFILHVEGTLSMKGNVVPEDDNTWDIGTTSMRWKTIHVGPGSFVAHYDATDTKWARLGFTGTIGTLATDAASQLRVAVGAHAGLLFGVTGVAALGGIVDVSSALKIGDNTTGSIVLTGTTQSALHIDQKLSGSVSNSGVWLRPTVGAAGLSVSGVHVADYQGSAPSSYTGVLIDNLTDAVATYGVRSLAAKHANRWFLYATGDANSYLAGCLGLGNNDQTDLNAHRLVVGTTGDTTAAGGILLGGDVNIYRSAANLLRVGDKAQIDDVVGIGGAPYLGNSLTIAGVPGQIGQAYVAGVAVTMTAPASATSGIYGIVSEVYVPAGMAADRTFGFSTGGGHTLDPSATINYNFGVVVQDLTVGTNRYAFHGMVLAGTDKWNFYAYGSALNYLNGNLGIGNNDQPTLNGHRLTIGTTGDTTTAGGILLGGDVNIYRSAANLLRIGDKARIDDAVGIGADPVGFCSLLVSGVAEQSGYAFVSGLLVNLVAPVSGISGIYGIHSQLTTASFGSPTTIAETACLVLKGGAEGANATITDNYGVLVSDFSGGTNKYAFGSQLSSGTNKWNLYLSGTATNYLAGALGIGNSNQTQLTSLLNLGTDANTTAPFGIKFGGSGLSNLYRSAADTLKTDGNFIVAGSMTFSGGTSFSGALNLNYGAVQTATYAVVAADCVVPVDSTAGAMAINLPAVTALQKGRLVVIKDVSGKCGTNYVTLTPNGADTIDGQVTGWQMDRNYQSISLVCNGINGWDII